ncbi:succinate dehydrogenase / fumarate reductase cytochrome b subunit [Actinokineospora auranticolor]|uniref:Succinate dehydrogenase / fumarate reductase cytochrome b subunit n=2 Tax=Actinokineospora auranticolor TaxID=155976 RepID=A0A2S6GGE8_9PSEU|nr:succinate dehydrogenase / fumarate reductase cytochrome b subunit [Actinokineospora auranticolor]
MAVTGAVLFSYVVVHMAGNLKFFGGPDSINGYGVFLREFLTPVLGYGGLVWVVRVVLLLAVVLHGTAAVQLARRARKARPVGYAKRPRVQGGYAARTMRWGGVILALFVVYHLLDLTAGVLNPHGVDGDIHANVVADFQHWYVVLAYTLAVVALGFHLRHGLWSAVRSLGGTVRNAQTVALVLAVVVTVGFLAVPFSVFFGFVR